MRHGDGPGDAVLGRDLLVARAGFVGLASQGQFGGRELARWHGPQIARAACYLIATYSRSG